MRDEQHVPGPASTPRRAAPAQTQVVTRVYRPGAVLATALMLSPALLSLLAAGVALVTIHAVPLVVPALLLLLLPAIAAGWVVCVSVRTTALGIGSARLLRPWHELPWALIEQAQRHRLRVVLISSAGQRIAFIPWLLSDGKRLYRDLLVRLPANVLDAQMAAAANHLLGERILQAPDGGLTGSLSAQPRATWRAAALSVAVMLLLVGAASLILAPPPISLVAGLGAFAGSALAIALLRWCSQRLHISEDGVQIQLPFKSTPQRMAWNEVALIEHTPGERVLRLRGDRRLICAGPGMLHPEKRDQMRAFLHTYCISRGVPVAQRRWLI